MNKRQQTIAVLLDREEVASQTQLVSLLAGSGIDVTQATVSRDLDRLGAVRVRRGGQMVYALPADGDPPHPFVRLRDVLGSVRSLEASQNLLIMRTGPGDAMPVARAFDVAELPEVAGTIGGDDTILLIAREPWSGTDLAGLCGRIQSGEVHV